MKKDISTPTDVKFLVDSFYNEVRNDDCSGYIFDDLANVDCD